MTHDLKRRLLNYFESIGHRSSTEEYLYNKLKSEIDNFDITCVTRSDVNISAWLNEEKNHGYSDGGNSQQNG